MARRFTGKDVLRETRISQLAVAPDGSTAVYARRTIEGGEYRTRLWRVPLTRGRAEQITTGELDVRPRFSPDGHTVLFLSRRSGTSQPWLLPLGGGEPTQLADFPTEVGVAEWSPGGERVLALAESGEDRYRIGGTERPTARRIADLSWRLDLVGYSDQFTSLWVVPATGGKPKRLTEPRYEVAGAFWSADGKRIGYLADQGQGAALLELPQAWAIPAGGGRPTRLASLRGEIAAAAWSSKGRLAFLGTDEEQAPGWTNIGLWVQQGRSRQRLGAELDRTFCFLVASDLYDFSARFPPPLVWLDDENLLVLATDGGTCVPYRIGLDGLAERLVERGDAVCSWLAAGGGRVAVVANVAGAASEVYAVEDGDLRQLSRNGSRWLAPYRQEPERHFVRHRDGHDLEAWVLRPRGRRSRGLVLQIHGGPHLAHGPTPWLEMLALADAGFTVLYGNPRGSVGYGEQFAKAIDGDWGNTDASDCLRLADSLPHGPVDEAQAVRGIGVAPVAVDRFRELLAVPDRAPRVPVEDGEAGLGEREHLEPRRRPVGEVGPAVDLEDETAAAPSSRPYEPGVEVVAVAVANRVVLRLPTVGREPAASVSRELPQVPILDCIDVTCAAGHVCHDGNPAAGRGQPGADCVITLNETLGRAVETEAVGHAGPAVGDEHEQVLVVEPEERRREASGEVVKVAGDEEAEGAVELGADALLGAPLLHPEPDVRPAGRTLLVEAEERESSRRRPCRCGDLPRELRELRGPAAARWDRPCLRPLEQRGLRSQVGQEADPRSVRGPEGLGDLIARLGQSRGLPTRSRDDPEARELVADADEVESPAEVGDRAGRGLLGIADSIPVLAAFAEREHALSVRRPLRSSDFHRELGQLLGLAACERQEPGLEAARTA